MDVEKFKGEIQSMDDQSTEALPMPLKVKQFSLYKNKVPEVPDAILGLKGLENLQLTIDLKKAILLPACTVGYILTTINNKPHVTKVVTRPDVHISVR